MLDRGLQDPQLVARRSADPLLLLVDRRLPLFRVDRAAPPGARARVVTRCPLLAVAERRDGDGVRDVLEVGMVAAVADRNDLVVGDAVLGAEVLLLGDAGEHPEPTDELR